MLSLSLAVFMGVAAGAGSAGRADGRPEFSHEVRLFEKPGFSILLPAAFESTVPREDQLVDGNARGKLWLWGQVAMYEGLFSEAELENFREGVRCSSAAGMKLVQARRIKTRHVEGFQLTCGTVDGRSGEDGVLGVGWSELWVNSRRTIKRFVLELKVSEPPQEAYVQEALDRIIYSLKEPKDGAGTLRTPPRKRRRAADEEMPGVDDPASERGRSRGFTWPWKRGRKGGDRLDEPVLIR